MEQFKKLIMVSILIVSSSALIAGIRESEEKILLSEVPQAILEAAEKAMPGIIITEAEIEKTDEGVVYELEGTVDGKAYEIEISEDGKVLEVELEENDDDDDDNDEGTDD